MRQMSEVKCDEACVKNEAFRGCGMGLVSSIWVLRTEAYEGLGMAVGAEVEAGGWHVGNGRVNWAGLPMIVHPRGVWMAS